MNKLRTFLSIAVLFGMGVGLFGMDQDFQGFEIVDSIFFLRSRTKDLRTNLKRDLKATFELFAGENKGLFLGLVSKAMGEQQAEEVGFYIKMLENLSESFTNLIDLKLVDQNGLNFFSVTLNSVIEENFQNKKFYKNFKPTSRVLNTLLKINCFISENREELLKLNTNSWEFLFSVYIPSFVNEADSFFRETLTFLGNKIEKKKEERRKHKKAPEVPRRRHKKAPAVPRRDGGLLDDLMNINDGASSSGSNQEAVPMTKEEIITDIKVNFSQEIARNLFTDGQGAQVLVENVYERLCAHQLRSENEFRGRFIRILQGENTIANFWELLFSSENPGTFENITEEEVVVVSDDEEVPAPPVLRIPPPIPARNYRRNIPAVAQAAVQVDVPRPDGQPALMALLRDVLKAKRDLMKGGENVVEEYSELDNDFIYKKVEVDPRVGGFMAPNINNIDFNRFKSEEDDDEEEGEDGNWSDDE